MPDIFHHFPIEAPIDKVFACISTPKGLDSWWAKTASGTIARGEILQLYFEPDYHWTARISIYSPPEEFELTMQESDEDWEGTRVGFRLKSKENLTEVEFYHLGWKSANKHYCISNFCWAMYLRLLKLHLERGLFVPYAERLDA